MGAKQHGAYNAMLEALNALKCMLPTQEHAPTFHVDQIESNQTPLLKMLCLDLSPRHAFTNMTGTTAEIQVNNHAKVAATG